TARAAVEPAPPTAAQTNPVIAAMNQAIEERAARNRQRIAAFFQWLLPPLFGIFLFVAVWALISYQSEGLPGPIPTWDAAVILFSDPFYNNGPNDMGIGWNILNSLQRVGIGFGMAALIGIPLGFVIGRFAFVSRMTAPIIGMLRPVSPLAWLPIGLLV